jgi:hypothetical protein
VKNAIPNGQMIWPIIRDRNMNAFESLDAIDKPTLTTGEAAHFLNRKQQTLRNWAIRNDGPVKCVRIGGRLAWPTAAVRALLAVARPAQTAAQ